MKTAEEWAHEIDLHLTDIVAETEKECEAVIVNLAEIKQIQLDAYKAGMTDAAEVCKSTIDENGMADAKECADRILTARDEKKTI